MSTAKKAEMGVGTLIVFIAMLLVAAVAAGVLIQTGGSLQERSLSTGQQAKGQISTNARATEVSATDGRDGNLTHYSVIYKLSPGSDPIKLADSLFSESTSDTTSSMVYRNALPINDVFAGYFTATDFDFGTNLGAFKDRVPSRFASVFGNDRTSEMMIGKIAVNIIFVESDGSIDTDLENWTTQEEDDMIDATRDALNWWQDIEPRAGIRHTFKIYRGIPTSYEPITRDTNQTNQTVWMTEALDAIGAPAGPSIFYRIRDLNKELREEMNAHWAFTIFMVDSSETGTGFPDGFAGIAYINGPHLFVANSAGSFRDHKDALMAHEIAHIFGAHDEYSASGCACDDESGYFDIETQNCDMAGCMMNQTSIMRAGAATVRAYDDKAVNVFTLGQLGLIDANNNNLLDPIEILFDGTPGVEMSQEVINSLVGRYHNPSKSSIVGFFTGQYMQESTSHRDGNLQRGDIYQVMFESARPIGEDEYTRLTFIPKIGTQTVTEFMTPEVVTAERVYLYP